MKILLAFIHYPVSSGTFLKRALKRLGHDVLSVGPYTHNNIWGGQVDVKYSQMPDFVTPDVPSVELAETLAVITRANRMHRREVVGVHSLPVEEIIDGIQDIHGDDWTPDLIITSDSAFTLLGESDCPHICNAQDNHVRDYAAREWDAIFCAHSWGYRMGEPNAHHCPPCYDPVACTDMGKERTLDVLMLAVMYQKRVDLASYIEAAGINITAGTGLIYEEYAQAYNQAKISLILSAYGDVTNRFLETAAMGCCIVADKARDLAGMGFLDGRDYFSYESPDEAAAVIKMLLADDALRTETAARGQAMAKWHTWDIRAKQMLETVGLK